MPISGPGAPDSTAFTIYVEKTLSNPRVAAQYAVGDVIQYGRGNPGIEGIAHKSSATVLSVDARNNTLTVQTSGGDGATYDPSLLQTMTAAITVFRQEQREIAEGDRIQFTRGDSGLGNRKGELGTVASIDTDTLDVQLDKGSPVQLTSQQAHHIEHGYAVESIKSGSSSERVLFTHDVAPIESELDSLFRKGREVNLYTSDGSIANKPEPQRQSVQNQTIHNPIAMPPHPQLQAPGTAIAPPPPRPAIRIRIGR